MSITLRENQIEPIKKGIEFFQQKEPKPSLIVLPVAWGKSILVSYVANQIEGKTLTLAPNKELLIQNYKKLLALGGEASIYSASLKSKQISQITYATIGSIKNIGSTFKELGFRNLIIDEAHNFSRNSDGMLQTFLKDSGITHTLGLSATPLKLQTGGTMGDSYSILKMLTSRSKHGNFFKEIIHVSQVKEMVGMNYWAKLIYEIYDFDTGKLVFNSTKAEYTDESIAKAYEDQDIEQKIINCILNNPNRKSILVAVPSVEQAKNLAAKIEGAVAIWGDMDDKLRDKYIEGFLAQKIRVVIQVNVLSLGFDFPLLDMVICGRATASFTWFYQFLGRICRIDKNKINGLIVDFVGLCTRFGKIEDVYYKKEANTWKLFGSGGNLLSGLRLDMIGTIKETPSNSDGTLKVIMPYGKYKDKEIKDIPSSYRDWMLKEWEWKSHNNHIKKEILRLKELNLNSLKV